jgi:transcriptional regulator with GAF, ATPase, and Fis domain
MIPLETAVADIIGQSLAMKALFRRTRLVAPSRATVLLVGETGTGKELIARAIHRLSRRADGPYVRVNCGALSENLLESELFGHVKGAFTGAVENKTGRFEAAHGGTIFLDEVSCISPKLQVKLLRVLQAREFERVGESRTVRVDSRVVAATNRRLEKEIQAGRFREDLYYRLNVVPIYLPPLRERPEDIPALAHFFLQRYSEQNERRIPELPANCLEFLTSHYWPGNVRELENCIERAVVLTEGGQLTVEAFGNLAADPSPRREIEGAVGFSTLVQELVQSGMQAYGHDSEPLHERIVGTVERELIEQVLKKCGHVQVKAAARLGINRNTLHKKLAEMGGVAKQNVDSLES